MPLLWWFGGFYFVLQNSPYRRRWRLLRPLALESPGRVCVRHWGLGHSLWLVTQFCPMPHRLFVLSPRQRRQLAGSALGAKQYARRPVPRGAPRSGQPVHCSMPGPAYGRRVWLYLPRLTESRVWPQITCASVVVRESKSAVEKERGALSTTRRSKRENAHARVRMLRRCWSHDATVSAYGR